MNRIFLLVGLATAMLFSSCTKDELDTTSTPTGSPTNNTSQDLFFSFQTPDWQRTIACDQMDFNPSNEIATGLAYALATSASTNATFGFPFPTDSSVMALTSNINTYRISAYNPWGETDGSAFEISLKLNKNGVDDPQRLYSLAGLSENNYNQVTSVTYVGSDINYANFIVSGNYKMNMVDYDIDEYKTVTGSYRIKFKTRKQ
jgi:hypothetical protein